ncbi:hypothetical protein [Parasphingorhabdus sp.]|uniref:hypothetical protein n=1 Tax=Parasphingorhabdus sp. TaxID=2709688 RepID=UPI0030014F14
MIDLVWKTDRERRPEEKDWPAHVFTMDVDRLGYLGVDKEGNLYWDGKLVEVRKLISFSGWQVIFGVAGLAIAGIGAGSAAVSAYVDLQTITQATPPSKANTPPFVE